MCCFEFGLPGFIGGILYMVIVVAIFGIYDLFIECLIFQVLIVKNIIESKCYEAHLLVDSHYMDNGGLCLLFLWQRSSSSAGGLVHGRRKSSGIRESDQTL